MSNVFVSRVAPVKDKAAKRVSRLAVKISKAVREGRKSGPVTVIPGGQEVPKAVESDDVVRRNFLMGY